jgi:hypothetical protein
MTNDKDQQEQPRRILEKSRTVRRRYQRSNKRLEFTPSQIQRIEREEERERKAQQLRDREKKKLSNKKKKTEKEAKEREERRRLGIPDPNIIKIPASQPLLLNFFGAGNKAKQAEEKVEERKECCVSTENESTETPALEDVTDAITETFSEVETELGDYWLDDVLLEEQIVSKENIHETGRGTPSNVSNATFVPHKNEQATVPAQNPECPPTGAKSLGDSFEDDTALLLQGLDPSVLQTFETAQKPQLHFHSLNTESTVMKNIQRNVTYSTLQSTCTTPHVGIPKLAGGAKIWNGRPIAPAKELEETITAPSDTKSYPQFPPKKTISQDTNGNETKRARFEMHHVDAEDEYDDLPLSTQDLRDLDRMIGLG